MKIPNDIIFSSKVVVVPGPFYECIHSGELTERMTDEIYPWVSRGDPIGKFQINGSYNDNFISKLLSSKIHSASIRSPVSGIVLNRTLKKFNYFELEDWISGQGSPFALFAILVPDDEPKPESSEFVYSDMCKLIIDMKHYYYKDSKIWTKMRAFTPEKLNYAIKLQMSAQPITFDAVPDWIDNFNEMRNVKPELRKFIKHLK